jgi:hypothetical protein
LSENWIVAFICSRSNLTVEDLKAAKAYDPDAPRQLFCYELGCETSLRLGKECHDQAVLRAACLAASEASGSPLETWTRGVEMTKDGEIRWPRYGVYSVAFGDDNMSVSATHLPSGDKELFFRGRALLVESDRRGQLERHEREDLRKRWEQGGDSAQRVFRETGARSA